MFVYCGSSMERIEGVRDREGISSFPRYFSTYAQFWLAFLVREYVNVDTLDSLSVPKVTDRFSFNQEYIVEREEIF